MPVSGFEAELDDEVAVAEAPPVNHERMVEQALAASILARPDLLGAVSPDPHAIGDPTVRAMLNVVAAHGAAYTAPATMMAALDALPQTVDTKVAVGVLSLVPEPEDVDLGVLLKLKSDVEQAARDRRLLARLDRAKMRFGAQPSAMALAELREALNEYDRGGLAKQDMTTKGALDRLKNSPPKVRYKLAYGNGLDSPFLDEPFKGIGPDGHAGYGASGLGEVIVAAAGYGVGKTRVVDNWKHAFLLQGASVATVMLEDDESANITNLMGIHADLPYWMVEQYARGELAFFGSDLEKQARLDEALAWYGNLGDRHRVYDGSNTEVDIFDFDSCLRLLELDVRLYKTTHIVVDYVQQFAGGEETEHAARFAQRLRAFAGRHKVSIIEISQVSNETMKWGSVPGQVAAKGSAAWGQAAHIGFELEWEPSVGQEELRINRKKARRARRGHTYCRVNENTGRILAYYDTPMLMSLPEEKPAKKEGSKRK